MLASPTTYQIERLSAMVSNEGENCTSGLQFISCLLRLDGLAQAAASASMTHIETPRTIDGNLGAHLHTITLSTSHQRL
eukprot:6205180-Pleurochrysis_carterae.AAC.4